MRMNSLSRRHFLQASAALAGSAIITPAVSLGGLSPKPLRLGGPIFLKSDDPTELAREHRRLQYGAAYVPAIELTDTTKIAAMRKAFADQNVLIAEVGAWVNMLDRDAKTRQFVIRPVGLEATRLSVVSVINNRPVRFLKTSQVRFKNRTSH